MKNHTKSVLIGIGIIIVLALLYINLRDTQTVEVIGNSKITVPPDEVSVYLSIQTKAVSAEEAKNQNSIITDKVMNGLKQIGIENIETENFNIYPEYDYSRDNKITGYTAYNSIKIKTSDFDSLGKIVDISVDNGALINSINFELSTEKSNEVKADALAKASQDAKAKANAIALGLDKKLGSLVSVSTSDYGYSPYPIFRGEAAEDSAKAQAATLNIEPRSLDVTATVQAVYKIR